MNRNTMLTPHYHHSQTSAPAVQAPPPAGRSSYRTSEYGRPASSVYSQPSPEAAHFAAQQLRNGVYYDHNGISPPSSPDIEAPANRPKLLDPEDVSPLDEGVDKPPFSMERAQGGRAAEGHRSNIPQMRRDRRKNSDAAQTALRKTESRERLKPLRPHNADVRWDKYSGEPTTGNHGLKSQVNAQEYAQEFGKNQGNQGLPTRPADGPQDTKGPGNFVDRVRRIQAAQRQGSQSPQPESEPAAGARPEWRGGSGRTTLVAPVNDQRNVPPLDIPRKSSKRAPRGAAGAAPKMLSPVSSVGSETGLPAPVAEPAASGSAPAPSSTARQVLNGSHANKSAAAAGPPPSYPSPPVSDGSSPSQSPLPANFVPSEVRAQSPATQSPSPHSARFAPNNEKAIRRKPTAPVGYQPPATAHAQHPSTSSSLYSQHDIHPAQLPPGAFPSDWTQPPSRLSMNAVTTSLAHGSPQPNGDAMVASSPLAESPRSPLGSSVLDRKRPVVGGYEFGTRSHEPVETIKLNMDSPYYTSTKSITRPAGPRPVPGKNPSDGSVGSPRSPEGKELPATPMDGGPQDRVAQLNGQLKALGNRRININQAIKQMTKMMPTDNILASAEVVRKREYEKRKIESLNLELSEVQREEYELGLKLHRAYKRLDREAEFEPTSLWVRRAGRD